MIELGELEANHEEFEKRRVQVVVVSLEGPEEARLTQDQFPHVSVIADANGKLIEAAQVLHVGAGKSGEDTAAPTTFLIDRQGVVRFLFRPRQVISRVSAKEVLAAVDRHLGH